MTKTAGYGEELTRDLTPRAVIADYDADARPRLNDDGVPNGMNLGDLTGAISVWHASATAAVPSTVGAPSADPGFPAAGQVKFGRGWIAPSSVGSLDFTGATDGPVIAGSDPSFHRTDTLDLGIVEQGEAELQLEDGRSARLSPGTFFVIAGMQHRWVVQGEKPFVFTVATIGTTRDWDGGTPPPATAQDSSVAGNALPTADVAALQDVVAAFGEGDLERVLSHFAADVIVHQADHVPHGGTHRGKDQLTAMLATLDRTYAIESDAPVVEAAGDRVVLRMRPRFTARATGRSVVIPTIEVYCLHEGLITNVEVFYQDTAALSALTHPV